MNDRYKRAFELYSDACYVESLSVLKPLIAFDNFKAIKLSEAAYLMLADHEKSFEYANKGLQINPDDVDLNASVASILYHGYMDGMKDYKKAFSHYKKAADGGHTTCTARVGYMYEHGEGVDLSQIEARKYYKIAGLGGHVGAKFQIASTYFKELKPLKGFFYYFRYIVPLKIAQARGQVERTLFY